MEGISSSALKRLAIQEGMMTLRGAGLNKILSRRHHH
jgi:hypothetical protein